MLFKKKENEEEKKKLSANNLPSLDKEIEAILFYRADEVSLNFLAKILAKKKKEIVEALNILAKRLENSALVLMQNEDKALLALRKDYAGIVVQIKGEEKMGELSSSALETLAIILYKGPISKAEIDQIRGVNSAYILRNLLIRGLVERKNSDGKIVYQETFDLLRYLGVEKKESLPAYEKVIEKLNQIDQESEESLNK